MRPARFRKRPLEITALQWRIVNAQQVKDWLGDAFIAQYVVDWIGRDTCLICKTLDNHIGIKTLEGRIYACPMDWIICGIQGEFYPCKPDIFEDSYEAVR